MKTHTTNYYDTFITIADDSPVSSGQVPPVKGDKRSVANMQFDLISNHPYEYTSDDLMVQVYAERNDLTEAEYEDARKELFSKGQPCLRASPLTKRYGWGVHFDSEGKAALYGAETPEYKKLSNDDSIQAVPAMRSKKA